MSVESPVAPKSPESPGRTDAERVRRSTGDAPKRRGRKPKAPPVEIPLTQPEEREFWGRQMQGFWNGIASARGYTPIPDEQVNAIGEPAALTAKKYLKDAQEEHPEYLLLFVLTPYIMGAIRVEWERWTRRSRAASGADAGGQRGRVRAEGQREDDAGADPTATTPFTLPGH